ncbi:glutathione S-transferase family protein [Noviherbaspirillum aerium]|uniref:glutathione S-transferase family protein n=1 Tax=Noviherbaspirillum aerium TaxID=2588497 RepID=UPI00124E5774|nr:glutathione S-transferase family protein [Noviherbaspirillum aerium]
MTTTSHPPLTLISHKLCPYVQRAVIALKEKQVDYQRIDIDLNAKPKWFLALSPLGKTPVLRVGHDVVFESAVICEYLEDTVGPALHPQDALQRARHRAWIEFASATLNAIWSFYTAQDNTAYEAAAAVLADRFRQLEKAVGDGPHFSGERFSLVDAAFAPVFRYFDVFDAVSGIDFFADAPKLRAWRAALAQRPSVRSAVTEEYASLLAEFVIRQGGVLGRRLLAAAPAVRLKSSLSAYSAAA